MNHASHQNRGKFTHQFHNQYGITARRSPLPPSFVFRVTAFRRPLSVSVCLSVSLPAPLAATARSAAHRPAPSPGAGVCLTVSLSL